MMKRAAKKEDKVKRTKKYDHVSPAGTPVPRPEEKGYELLTAVFEVRGSKAWDGQHEQTYCVMRYVRLEAGLSAGAVIVPLQREISQRHKVPLADVMFRFWCDTYEASGGSPKVFAWDANKLNAVEVR